MFSRGFQGISHFWGEIIQGMFDTKGIGLHSGILKNKVLKNGSPW